MSWWRGAAGGCIPIGREGGECYPGSEEGGMDAASELRQAHRAALITGGFITGLLTDAVIASAAPAPRP
jgi:hypothetical protein